jgi:hypothetical protein
MPAANPWCNIRPRSGGILRTGFSTRVAARRQEDDKPSQCARNPLVGLGLNILENHTLRNIERSAKSACYAVPSARPSRRLSVRRAEMQCERIRKLISRWHRDELEAERKAAAVEMRDSLDALLGIFHDRGKLRTLCDALERGARRRSRRNREQKS